MWPTLARHSHAFTIVSGLVAVTPIEAITDSHGLNYVLVIARHCYGLHPATPRCGSARLASLLLRSSHYLIRLNRLGQNQDDGVGRPQHKSKALNELIFAGGAERLPVSNWLFKDVSQTWRLRLVADGSAAAVAQWQRTTDTPLLSNHMSYVTAVDNAGAEHHYVMGGQKGGNEPNGNLDDVYEFDPVREVWTQRQDMPFSRGHASASTRAVSCGFFIIASATNGSARTKDMSYYDIPSNSWTKVGELTNALNSPICDIDFKNKVLYCETGIVSGTFSKKISIEV
jgi:hypothetical protein